jgi:AmmeMemoRadiSam system protein A
LLLLARTALTEVILRNRIPDMPEPAGRLAERGGAFVTLFCRGKLRGCVGMAGAELSLSETVVQAAISAARHDPRFAAVAPEELAHVEIEISILTEPQPTEAAAVEVGRHGLLVIRGRNRGLLLPQVAAQRAWSAERFLEETCRKAGLAPAAWRDPRTELLAFTAEVFFERDFQAPVRDVIEDLSPSQAPEGNE